MQNKKMILKQPASEFLIYQTEDGRTKIEVRFEGETVWLTQKLMADLFQVSVPTINEHIKNIYEEGELRVDSTIRKFRIVQIEGARKVAREVEHYNLDVVISAGYRVRSYRGTQFRIWATERLREFIVKGFALDDERLKSSSGGNYFEELLDRIRDIRSSEKVFWRKVLDIYSTSIDYDPNEDISQKFFAVVQNKMHWAVHGHTAAEVIAERANATLPYMGLTSWAGSKPRKTDASIAKNYLKHDEIEALNLIVSAYLEVAELQARHRKPMYMRDWIAKLDDFLRLSEHDILTHAGSISREAAKERAGAEFEEYRVRRLREPEQVEKDFELAVEKIKQLEAGAGRKRQKRKAK